MFLRIFMKSHSIHVWNYIKSILYEKNFRSSGRRPSSVRYKIVKIFWQSMGELPGISWEGLLASQERILLTFYEKKFWSYERRTLDVFWKTVRSSMGTFSGLVWFSVWYYRKITSDLIGEEVLFCLLKSIKSYSIVRRPSTGIPSLVDLWKDIFL